MHIVGAWLLCAVIVVAIVVAFTAIIAGAPLR